MRTFGAIFETVGRRVASYSIVAESAEAARGMLDGWDWAWPVEADRLRILDDEGREALAVERPADAE